MRTILQNGTFRNGILGKAFVPIEFDALLQRAHHILTVGYTGELINIVATSGGEIFLFSFPIQKLTGASCLDIEPRWFTLEPRIQAGSITYTIGDVGDLTVAPIDDSAFSEPRTPMHAQLDLTGLHPPETTDRFFALVKGENGYIEDVIKTDVRHKIIAAGSIDDAETGLFLILNSGKKYSLIGIPAYLAEQLWIPFLDDSSKFELEVVKDLGFLFPKIICEK